MTKEEMVKSFLEHMKSEFREITDNEEEFQKFLTLTESIFSLGYNQGEKLDLNFVELYGGKSSCSDYLGAAFAAGALAALVTRAQEVSDENN